MGYINQSTDAYGDVQMVFGDGSADAFSRGRVALPESLATTTNQYGINILTMLTQTTGNGTVAKTANVSSVTLSAGSNISRSFQH